MNVNSYLGAMTGAIEMSVNFPTDYVKTQLQLDERSVKRRYVEEIVCLNISLHVSL